MARLDDICLINMGQSPESSSYNDVGDGIPFYQGNADFGLIEPTARMWCNAPTKIAEQGDILISVRAPIGALNFATEHCCIGRGLAALRVKTGNHPWFVFFALKSKQSDLNARGTGTTFKAINKKELAKTIIPDLAFHEQERVANTLLRLSTIVFKRRNQLATIDQLVKSRFVEAA